MAEAFFNHIARARNLSAIGISAGTMGAGTINPMAAQAMEEVGVSLDTHTPKLITQSMVDASDRIISMGCGVDASACPAKFLLTEDWGLDDPAGQGIEVVRKIRDQVRLKVERLIGELE